MRLHCKVRKCWECLYCSFYCDRRCYWKKALNGWKKLGPNYRPPKEAERCRKAKKPNNLLFKSQFLLIFIHTFLSFGGFSAFRSEQIRTQFFVWPCSHAAIFWPKMAKASQFSLQNSHTRKCFIFYNII